MAFILTEWALDLQLQESPIRTCIYYNNKSWEGRDPQQKRILEQEASVPNLQADYLF